MFVRIILQEELSVRKIKRPSHTIYHYYSIFLSEDEEADGIIVDIRQNIEDNITKYFEDIEYFEEIDVYEFKYSYISFFAIKHFKDNKYDRCKLKKSVKYYK